MLARMGELFPAGVSHGLKDAELKAEVTDVRDVVKVHGVGPRVRVVSTVMVSRWKSCRHWCKNMLTRRSSLMAARSTWCGTERRY